MNVALSPRMLGRRPVKFDYRTLQAAKYMKEVSTPPASVDWMGKVPQWRMYMNDVIGDCTFASFGNMIGAWSYDASGNEVLFNDQDIVAAYSAISGYDPQTGANDNGANELDVLNYMRKIGLAGHTIHAFVQLDLTDHLQICQAINLFGTIYTGVNLPLSAHSQIQAGQVWEVDKSPNGQPGSWGGHAVGIGAYDGNILTCETWGQLQRMTWAFLDYYFEEAYAVLSLDFLSGGKDPQGFDLATLDADLAAIGNKQPTPVTPDPGPTPPPVPNGCAELFKSLFG